MLSAEAETEADNTNGDLDYSGYHKNRFIIYCFEENNDKRIIAAINLTLLSVN